MAVIRIVKSFPRNLCPITKSFWNVCPANGFKWNGRANKLSEFVQIPRRLTSPCPAGEYMGVEGVTTPSFQSSHPIFSSCEDVISRRVGEWEVGEWKSAAMGGLTSLQLVWCSQACQKRV